MASAEGQTIRRVSLVDGDDGIRGMVSESLESKGVERRTQHR
jgi:hypothetical protein